MSDVSCTLNTPIGPLRIRCDEDGALLAIDFIEVPAATITPPASIPAPCREACTQLLDYFAGKRKEFDLELRPEGTGFQRAVWDELRRIPFGDVISYGEQAKRLGNPSASRAVGHANGANPIPVVIPCHRVVGANGRLTGYAGGLHRKQALLELEGWRVEQGRLIPAGAPLQQDLNL